MNLRKIFGLDSGSTIVVETETPQQTLDTSEYLGDEVALRTLTRAFLDSVDHLPQISYFKALIEPAGYETRWAYDTHWNTRLNVFDPTSDVRVGHVSQGFYPLRIEGTLSSYHRVPYDIMGQVISSFDAEVNNVRHGTDAYNEVDERTHAARLIENQIMADEAKQSGYTVRENHDGQPDILSSDDSRFSGNFYQGSGLSLRRGSLPYYNGEDWNEVLPYDVLQVITKLFRGSNVLDALPAFDLETAVQGIIGVYIADNTISWTNPEEYLLALPDFKFGDARFVDQEEKIPLPGNPIVEAELILEKRKYAGGFALDYEVVDERSVPLYIVRAGVQ